MTPNALAQELGVSGVWLRRWLRREFPRPASDKWSRWELTAEEIRAARAQFGPGRAAARLIGPTVALGGADWSWEGNVQGVLVSWLRAQGWEIEFIADTATRQQGDDIRARRDGSVLRVEVKGWPTLGRYADPARANEVKRTQPSTQAAHWFGQALLHVVRDLGRHPDDPVAIGLPDQPRYRGLIADTMDPLRKLGVAVWLVSEDGRVEIVVGHAPRRAASSTPDLGLRG
jgi:hypothetical protein